MPEVTISSKFQIVIPKEIRDHLKIKPGQKLALFVEGREIGMVPVRPIEELRDALAAFNATAPPFGREKDHRNLPVSDPVSRPAARKSRRTA